MYERSTHPQLVGHMGFPAEAPANTVASARAAVEAGADMIEIDVSVTADGHAVALHGPRLELSTSGQGRIRETPLDAIRKLWAKLGDDVVHGQPVPLVSEILDAVPEASLNFDLKERRALEPTLALIEERGLAERCVISGATAFRVGRVRRAPVDVTVLLNLTRFDKAVALSRFGKWWLPWRYRRLLRKPDVLALNVNHRLLSADVVDRIHALGAEVWSFTADTSEAVARLVELGADSITTNELHTAATALGRN